MKRASKYRDLTNNKSLFYTLQYEETHPVIMHKIEDAIMTAVGNGQYICSLSLTSLSDYDIKMITKVLTYYEFSSDYNISNYINESCQDIMLTIHWA